MEAPDSWGLRESNILLLILSPGYLASDYCKWEIVEYLKYEYSRPAAGEGIAPVYLPRASVMWARMRMRCDRGKRSSISIEELQIASAIWTLCSGCSPSEKADFVGLSA